MKKNILVLIFLAILITPSFALGTSEVDSNDIPAEYEVVAQHLDGAPIIEDGEGNFYYLDEELGKAYRLYFEDLLDDEDESRFIIDSDAIYYTYNENGKFAYYYDADEKIRVPLANFPDMPKKVAESRNFRFLVPYTSLEKHKYKRKDLTVFFRDLHIPATADTLLFVKDNMFRNIIIESGNVTFKYAGSMLMNVATRTLVLCNSLEHHFVIPEGTKAIGPFAFSRYAGDDGTVEGTSVTLPSSLETIDRKTFYHWQPDQIFFEGNDYLINDGNLIMTSDRREAIIAADRNVSIPDTIEEVYPKALQGRRVDNIPESIRIIGYGAFYKAGLDTHMDRVNLPDVEYIGDWAFGECGIKSPVFHLGSKLTYVGAHAFDTEVSVMSSKVKIHDLPSSLEYIGENAFSYVEFKSRVCIPGSVERIPQEAFYRCYIPSLEIGEGVKGIGSKAFASTYLLKDIVIPSSVGSIGSQAFLESHDLKSVEILPSDERTIVWDEAFKNCHDLENVVIPGNVDFIGEDQFNNCPSARIHVNEGRNGYNYIQAHYPSQLEVSFW